MQKTTIPFPKTDNLKHVLDHGFNLELTEPKAKAAHDALKAVSRSAIVLDSGKSQVCGFKIGEVLLLRSVLSRQTEFRFVLFLGESRPFKLTSEQYQALAYSLAGEKYPLFLQRGAGCQADSNLRWIQSNGWTLAGEVGVRALFGQREADDLRRMHSTCDVRARELKRRIEWSKVDRREEYRENYHRAKAVQLESVARVEAQRDLELSIVRTGTPEQISAKVNGVNLRFPSIQGRLEGEPKGWNLPGTLDRFSHEYICSNYKATVNPGEGEISLSSGIKCEVTRSQIVAWLKGGAPAPLTRYGTLALLKGRDGDGKPNTLLCCGCHRVNPSDLGEEVANLCAPTHLVEKIQGRPELKWVENEAEIRAILEKECVLYRFNNSLAHLDATLGRALTPYIREKKAIADGTKEAEISADEKELSECNAKAIKYGFEAKVIGTPLKDVLEGVLSLAKSLLSNF